MPTKVLYVEDEVFLAKIVKESLESRGYDVHWLENGYDINHQFAKYQPDVCVFDVMLPSRNGFELGKDIREIDADVPIIFLTAKSQVEDVLSGFSAGGNDYIKKPFSMEELIARMENLLSLAHGKAAPQLDEYTLGKFKFSPLKMELEGPNENRKLSHRETELLKMLCQHQNKPVQRKIILKELWGDDSFFNSRNLDVYITRLRKYLKADPDLSIKTLKGVGYQFVVLN